MGKIAGGVALGLSIHTFGLFVAYDLYKFIVLGI